MEQVLFRVHVRILSTSNHFLAPPVRKGLEYAVLIASLMALTTLVILHLTYVMNSTNPSMNCILTALEQYESVMGSTTIPPINMTAGIGIENAVGGLSQSQSTMKKERLLQTWRDNYDLIALKILPAPGSDYKASLFEKLRQWRDLDSSLSYISSIAPIGGNERSSSPEENEIKSTECINTNSECPSSISSQDGGIQITSYSSSSQDYIGRRAHTYLFAYTRGHLMLTQEPSTNNNKPQQFSTLQLTFHTNHECFGPPSSNFLANLLTGYDIVVMNWAISAFGGIGYLYNLRSKELFNLNYASNFVAKKGVNIADMGRQRRESYRTSSVVSEVLALTKNSVIGPFIMVVYERFVGLIVLIVDHLPGSHTNTDSDSVDHWTWLIEGLTGHTGSNTGGDRGSNSSDMNMKWLILFKQVNQFITFRIGVLFSTTFIFFVSSSLVSYILRETQERMLKFTYLLQYHVTRNLPYLPLIVTHVTESLVFVPIITGIYFFMFEFFSDQLVRGIIYIYMLECTH